MKDKHIRHRKFPIPHFPYLQKKKSGYRTAKGATAWGPNIKTVQRSPPSEDEHEPGHLILRQATHIALSNPNWLRHRKCVIKEPYTSYILTRFKTRFIPINHTNKHIMLTSKQINHIKKSIFILKVTWACTGEKEYSY